MLSKKVPIGTILQQLSAHTYTVLHTPGDANPYTVRMVGAACTKLDMLSVYLSADIIAHGKTLASAGARALAEQADQSVSRNCPVCEKKQVYIKLTWALTRANRSSREFSKHDLGCASCNNLYVYKYGRKLRWYGLNWEGELLRAAFRCPSGMQKAA